MPRRSTQRAATVRPCRLEGTPGAKALVVALFRATTFFLFCRRMGEAARPGPDGEAQVTYADAAVEANLELWALMPQYITVGDGWKEEAERLRGDLGAAQNALVLLINLMAAFTGITSSNPMDNEGGPRQAPGSHPHGSQEPAGGITRTVRRSRR